MTTNGTDTLREGTRSGDLDGAPAEPLRAGLFGGGLPGDCPPSPRPSPAFPDIRRGPLGVSRFVCISACPNACRGGVPRMLCVELPSEDVLLVALCRFIGVEDSSDVEFERT